MTKLYYVYEINEDPQSSRGYKARLTIQTPSYSDAMSMVGEITKKRELSGNGIYPYSEVRTVHMEGPSDGE